MGWQEFIGRRSVGDVIDGVVVQEVPFGSFVESEEGVHGLAYQQAWPVGTRVTVRIVNIDPERRRFSLEPVQA
ncbi:hypothetical protein [Actinocorallia longicatena]|uniref:S1 RNA-binding domain-containing protein n=1 Tax=Actinocorallia longicatena TaxID=111803 RepID=A0ABP6PYR2_9ACTN